MEYPVDAVIAQLSAALAAGHSALLVAEPGAGKTTRVPLKLIDAAWLKGQKIVMLEPRRLAARHAMTEFQCYPGLRRHAVASAWRAAGGAAVVLLKFANAGASAPA